MPANEEFVILLGDEPTETQAASQPKPPKKDDSFVILLDGSEGDLLPIDNKAPTGSKNASGDNGEFVILLGEEDAAPAESFNYMLDADCTIDVAQALYDDLTELLDGSDDLIIDASEVRSADTATLQLLVAASAKATKTGKKLSLTDRKGSFSAVAKQLDFARHLSIH